MSDREKRLKKLANICDTINKSQWGGVNKDAVQCLAGNTAPDIETWNSGAGSLNWALGGGWPRGRIIEVFGPESGGKSTTCLHAIAEFQKAYPDDDVGLIDTEFSFDPKYAGILGVNNDYLIVNQPESGEQALNVLDMMIDNGVKLIIVDSVAALTTQAELEGQIGDQHMAQVARLMSNSLKRLVAKIGKANATVIFTNQVRDKIGVTWGEKTTTPGGRALKFYSSVRVNIARIGSEKDGEEIVSNKIKATVKKNKVAPPFREANFIITFGHGIDSIAALLDEAIDKKIIVKKGAWFSIAGENFSQGRASALTLLREDKEFRTKIENMVKNNEVPESIEEDVPQTRRGRKKKIEEDIDNAKLSEAAVAEEV